MSPTKRRALLVFARTPKLGTVKKRLAATIGADPALHCYNLLLESAIINSAEVSARRFLYFYPEKPEKIATLVNFNQSLVRQFTIRNQKVGPDLGQKMATALTETLQDDNYDEAVLIGTDIPFLESSIIEQAFSRLALADIVLGPALDGGYYLIGLQRHALDCPEIFQEIPWGTDGVLQATINRAVAADLRVDLLTPLFDIDTKADLLEWHLQEKNPAITKQLGKILQKSGT
ncbi:TIGR04282 family arsenosugar biosynthesis glycosyltransferase [bacterium]|nr:TIGR04282 family arsenosugar biosynthesis glycosyltransferase [bacterium]